MGASSAQPQVRQRLSAAERRAQIIANAREVFIELGVNGARSRDIAQRAGITEAYLYRHFHSKHEIFMLAIDRPIDEMITHLRDETRELAARNDVERADVLLRSHELLLECMVEIAPLVAAALLSDSGRNDQFYTDHLFPRLRNVLALVIPDITGYPLKAFQLDMFVDAMIGIHLTIALEHLLENKPVDVPTVARQVTTMFAVGVGRPDKPAKRGTVKAVKSAATAKAAADPTPGRSPRSARSTGSAPTKAKTTKLGPAKDPAVGPASARSDGRADKPRATARPAAPVRSTKR
jgi:TetR/AcrR family transcriptional regulator